MTEVVDQSKKLFLFTVFCHGPLLVDIFINPCSELKRISKHNWCVDISESTKGQKTIYTFFLLNEVSCQEAHHSVSIWATASYRIMRCTIIVKRRPAIERAIAEIDTIVKDWTGKNGRRRMLDRARPCNVAQEEWNIGKPLALINGKAASSDQLGHFLRNKGSWSRRWQVENWKLNNLKQKQELFSWCCFII